MIKRGLAGLLLLLMIFCSIPVFAATNSFTILGEKVGGNSQIIKGDVFIYKISVKNNTAADIDAVKGKISGDFATESGNEIDFLTIGAGGTATVNVPMRYTGNSNRMNIYISGNSGGEKCVTAMNVTISKAVKTDTKPAKPPEPINKDTNYADFKLVTKDLTPTFYVGRPQTLEFSLENISNNYASEVGVKLVSESNELQFLDSVNPPSTSTKEILYSKNKKNLSISFIVKGSVPSGFYTIPAKISFKNNYGLSKEITKNIRIEVINNNKMPSVLIEEIKMNPEKLIPGDKNSVSLKLKNLSTIDIKSLTVNLKGLSKEGVTLDADKPEKTLGQIPGGGYKVVTYNVFASESLKTSRCELNLEVNYYDKYGKAYNEVIPVYLNTNQFGNSIYDLDINCTSISNSVIPGKEFTINFDVENKSGISQKNLKLNIKSEGEFIYKSQPTRIINNINAGEKQSYSVTMIASNKMTTNNYPVYITIEKADGSSTDKVSEYVGVYVKNTEGSSNPRIIIDNLELSEEKIFAGKEFDLSFSIRNTSKKKGIRNLKMVMSCLDGDKTTMAILPVNQISSKFVDNLKANGTTTMSIPCKVLGNAEGKIYSLAFDFEYEDDDNNKLKDRELVNIPVNNESKLVLSDVRLGKKLENGYTLQLDFFNTGKAEIKNMMADIDSEFPTTNSKYYIGNFPAGRMDIYEVQVNEKMPKTVKGTMVFTYEDAFGEETTIKKDFEIENQNYVDETALANGDENNIESENKGLFSVKSIIFFIAICAVIVFAIKKGKKIKMSRKA